MEFVRFGLYKRVRQEVTSLSISCFPTSQALSHPVQPSPQFPTASGESKSRPIFLGSLQKSFTEPLALGRISPVGMRIESTPILRPE